MPELPEVESLVTYLRGQAVGRTIERVQVASLSALKTYDPPVEALQGQVIAGTARRGKYLILQAGELRLVIHLARAGWLRWRDEVATGPLKLGKGPMALRVRFDDGSGFDVTEAGTDKRLAIWVVSDVDSIEHVATLGVDPLTAAFTAERFGELLRQAGGTQVKGALTDQRLIAGVGNAYSDEALHVARLSPFKQSNKLTADEVERLHDAVVSVLSDAVERSAGLPAAGLKSEKKSGMRVHGRTGEACPVCGDVVRQVSFATKSLQYCATCQTGGKPLADRRLSRLLK
ncbi:MAG TPA: DNA-formamidopyrimidine glycosylase family protein [Acidimicrobiales bacterium]